MNRYQNKPFSMIGMKSNFGSEIDYFILHDIFSRREKWNGNMDTSIQKSDHRNVDVFEIVDQRGSSNAKRFGLSIEAEE